jgi:transglutaminase-like putative cysteine protease
MPGSRPASVLAGPMFDPRHTMPRIGRILIARGRDAADVAPTTTCGPSELESFQVWSA